jgi:hypothetical protein
MKDNRFTISKELIMKMERKASREIEISLGFVPTHKVHKSKKTYTRKDKHKNKIID